MNIEAINLIKTKKELIYFILIVILIFSSNIFIEYLNYKLLIKDEVFDAQGILLNQYQKGTYKILKLKTNNFIFYTKVDSHKNFSKEDKLDILFITKYIKFYDYLKGFFVKSLFIHKKKAHFFDVKLYFLKKLNNIHPNKIINQFYGAIFLGVPICSELRNFCSNLGISHLIAISGFHLSIFSFFIYLFFNAFYIFFHQKYLNYRNKRYDLLLMVSFTLFLYLILLDFIPSFLRAFIMFIITTLFLRRNIKLLSFNTLLLTIILIISFFPKYIFSLSLWFSVFGVFYIYLFLKYFKSLPKIYIILFLNLWIFLAMTPIVHFYFPITSHTQLYSPLITLVFTFFYPISLFLHFIGYGNLLDGLLMNFFSIDFVNYIVKTPIFFFFIYLITSFLAIFKKIFFIMLNILLILFNIYIFIIF